MLAVRGPQSLYWESHGAAAAPPLLLIRGLARTARHWGPLVELLEPRFRVILFDNRGIGRSSVPRRPFTTADMADDASAVLTAAGAESAHVFGMSLGGMIAQEFALRHGSRVRSLVLGCTRAGGAGERRVSRRVVTSLLGAFGKPPHEAVKATADIVLSDAFVVRHPEVLERWSELARVEPPSPRGVALQLLAAARHDARSRLPSLRIPTLCVTGTVDRLIAPECSEDLARLVPGARLVKLGGAGHDFAVERPEAVAELLGAFCRDASRAA